MLTPIITTKLYKPAPPPDLVLRPRLFKILRTSTAKLTLISAPAGFGKTTLVTQWLAESDQPSAWLSLDKEDADSARFLRYLISAIQTIEPHLGDAVLAMLQSPQTPPPEAILPGLLNEIATVEDDFILVLDDYHLANTTSIDNILEFLLKHLPPQMRFVITTREDPNLPLARLRARREMIEFRAHDLRFTVDEATDFLNELMGLSLKTEDIAALEARTEGWIAGLQLAAISLQSADDIQQFIESFTGSHQFVMDYLLEEVLHQQPAAVQTFLLQTAILDRFCIGLCEAVLADDKINIPEIIHYLNQANLFIVPLDNQRHWYRYHHLFSDLLRQRVLADPAIDIAELHQLASEWYEAENEELEAFQHAVAANDIERATRLVEGGGMPLHFRGAIYPVINWLTSLPTATLENNPTLYMMYIANLVMLGKPEALIEEKLQFAEQLLKDHPDSPATRDFIGQIAANRAMLAIPKNDIQTIHEQSQQALELLHPANLSFRTITTWTLGLAYQISGERQAAIEVYTEAIRVSQASGNIMSTLAAATGLGQTFEAQTQFNQALETQQLVIDIAGQPPWPMACEAYLGMARIYYAWNDIVTARQYGDLGLYLAQQLPNVDSPISAYLLLAKIDRAQGNLEAASKLLVQAEQFAHQTNFQHRLPEIAEEQVRLSLLQGDYATAMELVETYTIPYAAVRLHIALGNFAEANELLTDLRITADQQNWIDAQLKTMILQALAWQTQKDTDQALQVLSAIFKHTQLSGECRLFLDEGLPIAQLLAEALVKGIMPNYVKQLLSVFEAEHASANDTEDDWSFAASQFLVEPLTERELEILRLIAQGYSNRDISEQLFLALSTVKGHNRNIFGKLQVQNRTEALARAHELGLI